MILATDMAEGTGEMLQKGCRLPVLSASCTGQEHLAARWCAVPLELHFRTTVRTLYCSACRRSGIPAFGLYPCPSRVPHPGRCFQITVENRRYHFLYG